MTAKKHRFVWNLRLLVQFVNSSKLNTHRSVFDTYAWYGSGISRLIWDAGFPEERVSFCRISDLFPQRTLPSYHLHLNYKQNHSFLIFHSLSFVKMCVCLNVFSAIFQLRRIPKSKAARFPASRVSFISPNKVCICQIWLRGKKRKKEFKEQERNPFYPFLLFVVCCTCAPLYLVSFIYIWN